jgi:hypothetical protein
MIRFSKEYASAQNGAYKRIVLENSGLLVSEAEEQEAQSTARSYENGGVRAFPPSTRYVPGMYQSILDFVTHVLRAQI